LSVAEQTALLLLFYVIIRPVWSIFSWMRTLHIFLSST